MSDEFEELTSQFDESFGATAEIEELTDIVGMMQITLADLSELTQQYEATFEPEEDIETRMMIAADLGATLLKTWWRAAARIGYCCRHGDFAPCPEEDDE